MANRSLQKLDERLVKRAAGELFRETAAELAEYLRKSESESEEAIMERVKMEAVNLEVLSGQVIEGMIKAMGVNGGSQADR